MEYYWHYSAPVRLHLRGTKLMSPPFVAPLQFVIIPTLFDDILLVSFSFRFYFWQHYIRINPMTTLLCNRQQAFQITLSLHQITATSGIIVQLSLHKQIFPSHPFSQLFCFFINLQCIAKSTYQILTSSPNNLLFILICSSSIYSSLLKFERFLPPFFFFSLSLY